MPKRRLIIPYRDSLYHVTISTPTITSICKEMEATGMQHSMDYDDLPTDVKEEILRQMQEKP